MQRPQNTVIRAVQYCFKDGHKDVWDRIESLEIESHKGATRFTSNRQAFKQIDAVPIGFPYAKSEP